MSEQTVRTLTGKVVSDKMDKSIVVLIERRVQHPLYGKSIRRSTKLHAHDENNTAKTGDVVTIKESLSKELYFMVLAPTRVFEAFFFNPGGDQPVCGSFVCDCVTAWFVALLGVWNSSCVLFVSVGVLVAGLHVSVWLVVGAPGPL
jgi:small subunit ribosomal protein S17